MDNEQELDLSKLRYVLYARRSRTDEFGQVKSIPAQIDECKALAKRLHINIVDVIEEKQSAKKPGLRDLFKDMLEDIPKKYDAILAWHPDRLARNMKEGGQIIDMVDEGLIKDMKFVTHHFSSDANGKMLLGMAFVLSKQYSDKLSQDVTRGNRHNLDKGIAVGTYKHGYKRDESGRYIPHETNFQLICDAWRMRKDGKPLKAIAKYMNDNGYARVYKEKSKRAGEASFMSDKTLSGNVFNDPFYYGILIQKGKAVDLREIPGYDFEPATEEETYNYVQSLTGRSVVETKRKVFKPLTNMVYCAYCQRKMYAQTPTSGRKDKTKILSYRCDTPYCPRNDKEVDYPQSMRANVIFNFMYDMLKGFKVTLSDYDKLQKRLSDKNKAKLQELTIKLHSKEGALKSIERDIKDRSLKLLSHKPDSAIYKNNEQYINELTIQQEHLQDEINKLRAQLTDPSEDALSFEEFLNVANSADLHLRAADVGAKDRIARLIYLNVFVDKENVVDYHLKEPFNTYFRTHAINHGRGERT